METTPSGVARRACVAFALAGALWSLPCAGSLTAGDLPRSRYDVISDKEPFGPPPPPPPPEGAAAGDAAGAEPEPAPPVEDAAIIPEGLDKIKITLLSRFRGSPAVGFIDGSDNRSYYLQVGQEFEGVRCEAIDLEKRTATLSRDGRSAELSIWINPSTTNCADVTTYGQPGGRPVDPASIQTKTDWEIEREKTEARRRMDESREAVRARREAARAEREERRREMEEQMAALTPEERDRRLHDINLDIIVNGKGPPLPLELDAEDRAKLREAGFDVPDESEFDDNAPRRRFGPRGSRGSGGAPAPNAP